MRLLPFAPLIVATGCNWVYGLEQTIHVDAKVLPPGPRTNLVWAIATTDGSPAPPSIDPTLEYKAIGSEMLRPMLPTILVGDDATLNAATYDTQDGSFEIPLDLSETAHRIVYTLPNDAIAHEVQWAKTPAYLVVPRTTRFDAPAPPANSGYTITPMGLSPATTLISPALYTSGTFTFSNDALDFMQSGSSITFQYARDASPLTGPPGAPQIAQGDWVMLAEWTGIMTQSVINSYALTQIDLAPGVMSKPVPEPTWESPAYRTLSTICTSMPANCLPSINSAESDMRLTAAQPGGVISRRMFYGVSPSTELPGFVPGVAPDFTERPLMLAFGESSQFDGSMSLADPSPLFALDRVFGARLSSTRTLAGGAKLVSSLQGITTVFNQPLKFGAPLVRNVMLGSASLSGTMDAVMVPAQSGMVPLTFDTEPAYTAHAYVVTLYEINGAALSPVRFFHVIAPSVKVEGSLLESGKEYVLGITAHTGFPRADRGDFAKAAFPFSSTTTFTRTFKIP